MTWAKQVMMLGSRMVDKAESAIVEVGMGNVEAIVQF